MREKQQLNVSLNCIESVQEASNFPENISPNELFKFLSYSIENAADEVFWMRSDSQIMYVNNSACRKLGYANEELVGMRVWEWDPLFPKDVWPAFWSELQEKKHIQFETLHQHKNGHVFPVRIRGHLLEHGKEEFLFAFVNDISIEKEQETKARNNFLSYLTGISGTSFAITDNKNKLLSTNDSFQELFGLAIADCQDNSLINYIVGPESDMNIINKINKALNNEGHIFEELKLLKKEGHPFWASLIIAPIVQNSQIDNFVYIVTDIDELKTKEEELKATNRKLKLITEGSQDGFWHWANVDSTIAEWSDRTFALFGYQPGEFESTIENYQAMIHPDDRRIIQLAIEQAINDKKAYEIQYRVKTKSGKYSWFRDKGMPFHDESGALLEMAGSISNIDEIMEYQESIKNVNLKLSEAINAGQIGVWDWDVENDVLVWDHLMFEMYGIPATLDENKVSLWEEALHPEDKASAIQALHNGVSGVKDYDIEFRIQRPCGEIRYIKAAATVLRDKAGNALRMVGTNLDVTESRRAEDEIRNLEKRNRALLDYSPVCHKIVDLDFKLRYMNRNGFAMLSLPMNNDWLGQPYPFAFFPADAKRLMEEKLAYVKRAKKQVTFESIAHDSKGNEVWLLHTLIPVFKDDVAELDYLTVVSADITEQKHAQDQLRHREKMDAIGQLAGGVAHDFNNQLAGISGYAELLKMEVSSEKAKSYLSKILASTKRSSDLTRQMLNYSRKQKLVNEQVDIHGELEDAIELLKHSVDKRIDMQTHFSAEKCIIQGDTSSLQNAFLNIAINAADAMREGGLLSVSTEILAPTDDKRLSKQGSAIADEYMKIVFEDNGDGIAKEHIEKVFDPFFTTKPVGKGTGMGLASVYGIVKQHQGFTYIESEADVGTRVFVFLPLCKDETSAPVGDDEKRLLTQESARKTILVVDDEQLLRELCFDFLTACGYNILLADNGKEGVEVYREHYHDIDLVLMDLAMPIMGGHEACRELKRINPSVKIIISSGYDSGLSIEAQKASEVSAIIEKPYKLQELKESVVKVLG
ncbi:PAS domain S-box protein [Alteromonas sediminis]|uniref:histidine kinase n=1 Tax=Alteromonas sediminis TaxID=2259342 RepID=A0A3N5Y8W0_9ALTE|nr:PAS domain S-box protein [Alteromonas sediminis]RPJ67639.1 PAS domain S-box protein [Alteromonas sediminis]